MQDTPWAAPLAIGDLSIAFSIMWCERHQEGCGLRTVDQPRVSSKDFTKKVKSDLGLNDWILPGRTGK